MNDKEIEYLGYDLVVTEEPPMWQVGIYPTRQGVPGPRAALEFVAMRDRAAAIAEAKRRVDALPHLSGISA
jgi:hypothetical protein